MNICKFIFKLLFKVVINSRLTKEIVMKGELKKYISALILLVLVFCVFVSCKKDKKDITFEESRLISMKTWGDITPDQDIIIKFSDDIVSSEEVSQKIELNPFKFEPPINGQVFWRDTRTLVLEPSEDLIQWTQYKGQCNLKKVLPVNISKGLEDISIEFYVSGRTVFNIDKELIFPDKSEYERVKFRMNLTFNMDTKLEEIKNIIKLTNRETQKNVGFEITNDSLSNSFILLTETMLRDEKIQYIDMVIKAEKLGMLKDYEKAFILPSMGALELEDIVLREDGERRNIVVQFSENLNEEEDYSAYFIIEPHVPFDIKILGSKAILRGDFVPGLSYTLGVKKGIKSETFTTLKKNTQRHVKFKNIEPSISFSQKGVILPSISQNKIYLKTVNIKRVFIKVKRIYPNNIVYFLQDYQLYGSKKNDNSYWNFNRVGDQVYADTLVIDETVNTWRQLEVDLNEIVKGDNRGIYLIEAWTSKQDFLLEPENDYYYYYSRPNFITKPVVISDIGITAKKTSDGYTILTNNLISSEPMSNVKIKVISYQNQVICEGVTNSNGKVEIPCKSGFIITGELNNQVSIMKIENDRLSTSLFDVGGLKSSPEGMKCFIYNDRGVYRPGDSIRVSLIARNQDETFPDNHPVKCRFENPRGQTYSESTIREASEGFYTFHLSTKESSPTGNWRVYFDIGGNKFSKEIKIETIAPYKLKVKVIPVKEMLNINDNYAEINVESKYLFGNPASNLKCITEFTLEQKEISFAQHKGFSFSNAIASFSKVKSREINQNLDYEGKTTFSWVMPKMKYAKVPLKCVARTRVLEKGGRPVPGYAEIPVKVFDNYVGLHAPDGWYTMSGDDHTTKVICVNDKGLPVSGKKLYYRVYQGRNYWWYDYDKREERRRHFKTDVETQLIAEGSVTSSIEPVEFSFTPEGYGRILVEVCDGDEGHCASYFYNVRSWGSGADTKDADIVNIRFDKEKYAPGDSAIIMVDTPNEGILLLSIEKEKEILYTKWYPLNSNSMRINIPVTSSMMPNVYAYVSIIQPHNQTTNDRPQRLYGIASLNVVDPSTELKFTLDMPEELRPEEEFEVMVHTEDGKPAQFTLAIVDEGLLDITRYSTPNPWSYFYQKEALRIYTADIYSNVIGMAWGDIFKKYTIGGDYQDYLDQMGQKPKVKRFKPVALFKGPFYSGSSGKNQSIKFKMPNYVGSVRVMAVASRGNAYGSLENTVPVKSELMILPEMPRVLGPGDEIEIPATVFTMVDNIGSIDVSVEIEGPLEVVGESTRNITIDKISDRDIWFRLKAKNAIGACKVKFTAKSEKYNANSEIEIGVRPSNPPIETVDKRSIVKGESAIFTIPDIGIEGTNYAEMTVSRFEKFNFNKRLKWLLHYPYGCIEQTTSSAFPQIYMKELVTLNDTQKNEVDKNINAAIARLNKFQLANGGMSYWPGGNSSSEWGSIYATHFLVEASKKGYHVPDAMMKNLVKYLQKKARAATGDYYERSYRLYVLALYNQPNMGAMNLLKQNSFDDMNNTTKWLLAASYFNAGKTKLAKEMIEKTETTVSEYKTNYVTYGSSVRDMAIMLDMTSKMGDKKKSLELFDVLVEDINSDSWYSTQTTAWSLLAIGKYINKMSFDEEISGNVQMPDGKTIPFDLKKSSITIPIEDDFGKDIKVTLKSGSACYPKLYWEGVPLRQGVESSSSRIRLMRTFFNENGSPINIASLKQGDDFWIKLEVRNEYKYGTKDIALVLMLPSGWEIENTRISDHAELSSKYRQSSYDYMDIRDDRVMWFFDLNYNDSSIYYVKINAVTPGSFYLPPTIVEAMYDNDFYSIVAGQNVNVSK